MSIKVKYILILSFLISLGACKSEYEQLVADEKKGGKIYTMLPFDLELGMTKKAYFDKCWKMNKSGMIGSGPGNQYAEYKLIPEGVTDSLDAVQMLFYGMFDKEDVMRGMDMKLEHYSWAPWNKQYHSPELMKVMETHFLAMYPGNPFMTLNVSDSLKAKVKVDGNRRITMYPLSNQQIAAKIIDMRNEHLLK